MNKQLPQLSHDATLPEVINQANQTIFDINRERARIDELRSEFNDFKVDFEKNNSDLKEFIKQIVENSFEKVLKKENETEKRVSVLENKEANDLLERSKQDKRVGRNQVIVILMGVFASIIQAILVFYFITLNK